MLVEEGNLFETRRRIGVAEVLKKLGMMLVPVLCTI